MSEAIVPIEYRLVKDFPNYRVGTDGSIWSRKWRGCRKPKDSWRKLKDRAMTWGHLHIALYPGGIEKRVHHLVLETFVGPCPPGMEGCHRDCNPANNALSNLRWDTPKGNMADSVRLGRTVKGSKNGQAKLTERKVRAIREEYAFGGTTLAEISAREGVGQATLCQAIRRKTWKHVV